MSISSDIGKLDLLRELRVIFVLAKLRRRSRDMMSRKMSSSIVTKRRITYRFITRFCYFILKIPLYNKLAIVIGDEGNFELFKADFQRLLSKISN